MAKLSERVRIQLCAQSSFLWASWGEEYVIFDEASGQTHLLDPIKAFVLDALTDGSLDVASLTPLLTDALVVPAEVNLQDLISAALEQLERAQLVEAIPL